jgi:hypothetical protein
VVLRSTSAWRAAPQKHAPASVAPSPVQAAASAPIAQKPVSAAPDRVQAAADSAEIATLKRELSEARDKLAKVAPKATPSQPTGAPVEA